MAVLKDSKSPNDANAFLQFLLSQKSKVVFEKYGFTFVGK
jgi:ABC-type molybdate transport system substrate-binding protein